MILAAKSLDVSDTNIREMMSEMEYQMDMNNEEEAQKAYQSF